MECVTCNSSRIERFMDAFGSPRIFCRNCWVSFSESDLKSERPIKVYTNFGAIGRTG